MSMRNDAVNTASAAAATGGVTLAGITGETMAPRAAIWTTQMTWRRRLGGSGRAIQGASHPAATNA
jgi:hypothetical protein